MADTKKTAVVGLSGGVDSAVAAALLIEQGYQVMGVSLSFWKAGENLPTSAQQFADAQSVARHLAIPWVLEDEQEVFQKKVVRYYLQSLENGLTPNACIICNKVVKWQMLMAVADQHGAAYVATGHYARIRLAKTYELLKACDQAKDQSYFLSILGQAELSRTLFPVGDYKKEEIRKIAKKMRIPVASRPESQDQCFFGEMKQNDFIQYYAAHLLKEGEIVHLDGRILGRHRGLAGYTIGQRKGINLPHSSALYVIQKDIQNNRLIVGEEGLLGRSNLTAGGVTWVSGQSPAEEFDATVKIRYRAVGLNAHIKVSQAGSMVVSFDQPVRDITPGQAIVVYQNENCLGMGFIE